MKQAVIEALPYTTEQIVRLRGALLQLVELEDRTLEGMSSCAPTSEEWLKAFNEARYVIEITSKK